MSTQIYNPTDNRAFRGTTVDVQSSTMNNGMGGSHLKLNQPKQAPKALLGSATKAAKFGKVLGPAGTIFNAGVSIATADKSQGAAGIAGDVFAETGGYMLGAAKGAALGTMIAPGIGTVIGGIGGGLLGSGVASWGMDQVQNLWRQNTSSKTGGLPADYKETEQKSFEDAAKFRNSPAPSTNPNGIKQSGTSMTIGDFEKNLGVIVSNTAAKDFESNPMTRREELQLDSNRDSLGALRQAEARRGIVNQGSDAGNRMRFVRTDDGLQRITKEGYQARMAQQAGTALDEGFVDKYKYDPTADKGVQKWMGKSKAEIDAAYDKMTDAEKKAEGMNMHKAFMASKNSGSTTSTNSISSGNPFGTNFSGPQQQNIRGSGMKNRRLGTFQSAHDQHTNFSGDQQTNERGSGQPGGRSVEDVFSRPDHKNFSGPKQKNKRGSGKRDAAQKALSRSQAHNGLSTSQRYMSDLVGQGYSPEQAAGIVGNLAHESGNFKFHEELEENSYGTKGLGHLQWTNAGGDNRRDTFEQYAKANKLDPKSYEANSRYLLHELKGGAGNKWTGGGGLDGFRKTGSLQDSVIHFQNNYVRPNQEYAHTDRRLSYAQQALDEWNKRKS